MSDDIVELLDAWADAWEGPPSYKSLVQRARAEIVAGRELHDRVVMRAVTVACKAARDEALEDAAKACDARKVAPDFPSWVEGQIVTYNSACAGCAFDVRALKDAP